MIIESAVKGDAQQDAGRVYTPPYIPYLTFKNVINWLESEGVPGRFDRSFWGRKLNASTGPLVVAAFRFLGLLKGEEPVPSLERLVKAKGQERKSAMCEVLQNAYTPVKFNDLERGTPGMLREWFKSYSIDGSTLRKAESFFINAAKDNDVPISNALRRMARIRLPKTNSTSVRGRAAKPKREEVGGEEHLRKDYKDLKPDTADKPPQSNIAQVILESGGEITLSLAVDLFKLSEKDRQFVMGLVDHVQSYLNKSSEKSQS